MARWGFALAVLGILYAGSYALLSWFGGYEQLSSGELRLSISSPIDDEFVWQPRWGFAHRARMVGGDHRTACDLTGLIYMPLIRLDQAYAHPTLRVITPDGQFHEALVARVTPLHPRERARRRL